MIQTYEVERGRFRYEVAVFTDGSVAVRRHNPEERALDWTDTFESLSSAEEELGIQIVSPGAAALAAMLPLVMGSAGDAVRRASDRMTARAYEALTKPASYHPARYERTEEIEE